jgi:hypothetical protein
VIEANNKSVPTATAGGKPKPVINIGVVSEPAPTPVMPIKKPIKHPPATIHGLAEKTSMIFVPAAYNQFDRIRSSATTDKTASNTNAQAI